MTDWISVKDRLPKAEVAVIVLTVSDNGYKTITTAMYENGKVSTDDSTWFWYEMDFDYDEDNDRYLIPEGWWEYRHFNPDEVYNNSIDDVVTRWMPMPMLPEEGAEGDESA